jgi:hypothetical protein
MVSLIDVDSSEESDTCFFDQNGKWLREYRPGTGAVSKDMKTLKGGRTEMLGNVLQVLLSCPKC